MKTKCNVVFRMGSGTEEEHSVKLKKSESVNNDLSTLVHYCNKGAIFPCKRLIGKSDCGLCENLYYFHFIIVL